MVEIAWFGFRERSPERKEEAGHMIDDEEKASIVYPPGKSWGLMLKPTYEKADEYQRIGIARLSSDQMEGWQDQTITVI